MKTLTSPRRRHHFHSRYFFPADRAPFRDSFRNPSGLFCKSPFSDAQSGPEPCRSPKFLRVEIYGVPAQTARVVRACRSPGDLSTMRPFRHLRLASGNLVAMLHKGDRAIYLPPPFFCEIRPQLSLALLGARVLAVCDSSSVDRPGEPPSLEVLSSCRRLRSVMGLAVYLEFFCLAEDTRSFSKSIGAHCMEPRFTLFFGSSYRRRSNRGVHAYFLPSCLSWRVGFSTSTSGRDQHCTSVEPQPLSFPFEV